MYLNVLNLGWPAYATRRIQLVQLGYGCDRYPCEPVWLEF